MPQVLVRIAAVLLLLTQLPLLLHLPVVAAVLTGPLCFGPPASSFLTSSCGCPTPPRFFQCLALPDGLVLATMRGSLRLCGWWWRRLGECECSVSGRGPGFGDERARRKAREAGARGG